ncbi:centromere kinetochore component CENP-T-domain-containing protein [Amylocarpus encephaloides]|uniref:Centromere kinetochore component CENP-T-domain-containing protein n=1 Tax=Amylocarpus encephaloides TaxID=45428 RepID=A0A9P8C2Q4_9HELO|nr:centromere kinetochore component CENP-T-domain-containing protein [Amylocarpus encephaloides]
MPAEETAPETIINSTTAEPTSQLRRKNTTIHSEVEGTLANMPYANRQRPGDISRPTTPPRRASSAGPPSLHKSIHRTSGAQGTTPNALSKVGGSLRKHVAVTPHGRAAQREIEARRAGLTPGNDRRRSGRQQRETPRDTLRALSRLLAPKSHLIVPTPTGSNPQGNFVLSNDDLDNEPDLERPRFSLPLGTEDDDDDSLLLPPRSTSLEDEDVTMQSIELGRRAISEQSRSRLSRGSFGSVRQSDHFGNLSGLYVDGYGDDSLFLGQTSGDDEAILDADGRHGDNTETLGELGLDLRAMSQAMGQGNTSGQEMLSVDETENTFFFTVPPRDTTQDLSIEEQSMTRSVLPEPVPMGWDIDVGVLDTNETTVLDWLVSSPSSMKMETSVHAIAGQDAKLIGKNVQKVSRKKTPRVSKHGIQYPSLPMGVVKRMATRFAGISGSKTSKLNKETLDAIMQASDWFFEQVSDDLDAYAQHARRRTIDESDIVTLMARQRQTNATTTPFSLAQKHLPRELLQELRMVPPPKLKNGRQLQVVEEGV